jgi:hypothetical protein
MLEWDTAPVHRTVAGTIGGAAMFSCPDCALAGTVYLEPPAALSQLVKLLTLAHHQGVVVVAVSAAGVGAP